MVLLHAPPPYVGSQVLAEEGYCLLAGHPGQPVVALASVEDAVLSKTENVRMVDSEFCKTVPRFPQ